jgi:eukaryotic-like serine/threonine-protein kinase
MADDEVNPEDRETLHQESPSFFDAETIASNSSPRADFPKKIGQYTIRQMLATGGMGSVFLAVQKQPKRTVALKVMRKGIVSAATLKRFAFESQVLARLRHPNIGQIFESGTFDDGEGLVPYFAMEYIPSAKTISEHVRVKNLNNREVLQIFTKVCDAVHHGHQKGVIHRDLKPDNILVDKNGEPKIIDFGVARSTESDLTMATIQTEVGQLVGTLQYMSPEQCDADPYDLDTRTDVYSLGIILYELLCGSLPYSVSGVAIFEAARVIKESQPQRPSIVNMTLRGDLETITLKALEKERDRRYQSATALAEDLQRFLDNEPIQARSASMAYQTKMFIRRNKAAFSAATSILVFMIISTVVSISFGVDAVRSGRAARVAEQEAITQRDIAVAAHAEAQLAREESDRQRDAALAAEAFAEKKTYLVNIAAVSAALSDGSIETAKRQLRLAPQSLRKWEWLYLSNLADQSIVTLRGHKAPITSVDLSANGSWVVSGSTDGSVKVFDPVTGDEPVHFSGHASPVYSIACSPDGRHFASASADMSIRIWNMHSGEELAVLQGHRGVVTSLAYSDDGRMIVSGASDSSIRLWDAITGEEMNKIVIEDASIDCVAMSPDGTRIASGSDDGLLRLWDPKSGEQIWSLDLKAGYLNALQFSPDGSSIASATEDGIVRLWNTQSSDMIKQLVGHSGFVSDVAFSPDGERLVSGSEDGTVRLWNLEDDQHNIELYGHDGFVNGVAFRPDGQSVASCSDDQTIKVWDANLFTEVVLIKKSDSTTVPAVDSIALSEDGARFIAGRGDGSIAFWDTLSGTPLGQVQAHQSTIRALTKSKNGSLLASASDDSTIKIYDTATAKLLGTLIGHQRRVTSLVFDAKDSQLVSGSWDGSIKIWDLESMSELKSWQFNHGSINTIGLSPDQSQLGFGSSKGDIVGVDMITGRPTFVLSGHKGPVNCIAFSADGDHLVSGSSDAMIRIWDTSSSESIAVLQGHTQSITAIALTPDGSRIISASRDKTMRVWTTDTGEEVCVLPWENTIANCIVVSSDGYQVASGSRDGSIIVRDSMSRLRRYQQRADSRLINGSAKRQIELYLRARLSETEIVQRISNDTSLGKAQRAAAMNRILSHSLNSNN